MPIVAWLILGGAALGVGYVLTQKKDEGPAPLLPSVSPGRGLPGVSPTKPGVPPAVPAITTKEDGSPPQLEPIPKAEHIFVQENLQYLAVVQVTGLQSLFANKDALAAKFKDLGFSAIFTWGKNDPIPDYFPVRTPIDDHGDYYWVQGFYQKPAKVIEWPSSIVRAWVNRGGVAIPKTQTAATSGDAWSPWA